MAALPSCAASPGEHQAEIQPGGHGPARRQPVGVVLPDHAPGDPLGCLVVPQPRQHRARVPLQLPPVLREMVLRAL
jgi:hypothetical protein